MNSQTKTLETNNEKILNPNWNRVQQALREMDGDTVHEVSLDTPNSGSLVAVGGNQGRYLVVYFAKNPVEESSLTLTDPNLSGPDVMLTAQTPIEYPARWAIQLPLVLKAFEHFYREGKVPKDVRWEIDITGEDAKL